MWRTSMTSGVSTASVLLAVTVLIPVLGDGAANATTYGGSRPSDIPQWVPPVVNHPNPEAIPLPADLTVARSSRETVITPDEAEKLTEDMWNLRTEAFVSDDTALMAEFETGPALEADEVTCGCNSRAARGPIDMESVFVPKQSTYPASFLAEIRTTLLGSPYIQYLIIARSSGAAPWRIVADPGDDAVIRFDRPALGKGGYDEAAAPRAATTLPNKLASYWHTWTETGHIPTDSLFAPGKWTTQAGEAFAKQPSGSWDTSNGLIGYVSYEPGDNDKVWSFATNSGGITCGVVRVQTVWISPGGGPYQPPAQDNWGPSVAPGTYRYLASTDIIQPCFVHSGGGRFTVTSGIEDPDTEQGMDPIPTPVSTTPTPTPPAFSSPFNQA